MLNWFRRIFAPDKWERAQLQKVEALKAHMVELSKMCMTLRAQQDLQESRVGWQVSAFIPEQVLEQLRNGSLLQSPEQLQKTFTSHLAWRLVSLAVQGLIKRDLNGLIQGFCFPEMPAYIADGDSRQITHRLPDSAEREDQSYAWKPVQVGSHAFLNGGDAKLNEVLKLRHEAEELGLEVQRLLGVVARLKESSCKRSQSSLP